MVADGFCGHQWEMASNPSSRQPVVYEHRCSPTEYVPDLRKHTIQSSNKQHNHCYVTIYLTYVFKTVPVFFIQLHTNVPQTNYTRRASKCKNCTNNPKAQNLIVSIKQITENTRKSIQKCQTLSYFEIHINFFPTTFNNNIKK